MLRSALPATLVVFLFAPSAHAEPALTLDRALALVRAQAPRARSAALRVDESRGRMVGATPLLADNPVIAGAFGRRFAGVTEPDRGWEARLELAQPIALGGQRRARIDAATAGVDAAVAERDAELVRLQTDVAIAFFRALAGRDRHAIAQASEATNEQAVLALERRHQLGDVPILDVNVARTIRARARARARAAEAERQHALGTLGQLLGLPPDRPPEITGDLRASRRYAIDALLARAQDRADVRALLAGAREADADVALAREARWPKLGVGALYERHEGADIVLGGVTVELPLFAREQALEATGGARARRLALEASATRQAAVAAVRAAHAVYTECAQGVRALAEALPLVDENETLARKSYEAGQLSLADWLVVRREALDTRTEYVDQLLAAAEAGVALAASAGVSP